MLRLIIILSSFFIASSAFAYTPPIGIPDPGMWGSTHPIDTPAPDTATKCPGWPGASASGCYYIDSISGTDTSNPSGYPNNPRATLPSNSFAAGSYIELHGGPYTFRQNLYMSGTAENPIWLRGTPDSMPTIPGYLSVRNSTYFYMENLDFNGGDNGAIDIITDNISSVSNNIIIRNCKFRNRGYTAQTSAVGITPYQGSKVHDVVIYNNEFSELGDWDGANDDDFHGINPDTYGRTPPTEEYNVWVLNNSFYHLSGNGVQVNANSLAMTPYLHHIYMGENTGHACRQAILWTKQGSHIIFSQNIAYDNRTYGSQPGTGMGFQYAPDNVWFLFNDIYDSSNGIRQSSTDPGTENFNVYMIGNKLHDIHAIPGVDNTNISDGWHDGVAFDFPNGTLHRHVIDNTVYDVDGAISEGFEAPTVISGNIFSTIDSVNNYHFWNNNARFTTQIEYTLMHPSARFYWGGIYTSLTSFQAAKGLATVGCIEADPLFVSPSTGDFHLQSGSPAKTAGVRSDVYTTFSTLYGISIDVDFDGNARPPTNRSLGAFEYDSDYVPPPADTTKPIVTALTIPSTSASLTVPITTFTATDNTAVTGCQITESSTAPLAGGANWRVVAPSTYTCATPGFKTLYAWAIDGAGNVSLSMSAAVTITVVAPPSGQGQARLQGAGHAKTDGPGHAVLGN